MKRLLFLASCVCLVAAPGSWSSAEKHTSSHPASRPAHSSSHGHAHHHAAHAKTKATKGSKHHPPIDCPLRKQGINPHKLRPFKDVQKYIQMLERPDRALWQKPDAVVKALRLKGHEVVADLGAGSGYFTFRIAKQLKQGKVFAIDIEPEMIRHIHHNAMMKGISNIHVILSKPDDPKVPNAADLVLICDVLHHVGKRKLWLKKLFRSLKSGARVVVIEFKAGKLPKGPPEQMKIPKQELLKLFTQTGFVKAGEEPKLLPYQEFVVFRKP